MQNFFRMTFGGAVGEILLQTVVLWIAISSGYSLFKYL